MSFLTKNRVNNFDSYSTLYYFNKKSLNFIFNSKATQIMISLHTKSTYIIVFSLNLLI